MRHVNNFINFILSINEDMISDDDMRKIDRLAKPLGSKEILERVKSVIGELKSYIMSMTSSDVRFSGDNDNNLIVNFGKEYHRLCDKISFYMNRYPFLMDYYPTETDFKDDLIISINKANLNKIDIITDIPYILRGLGLGKKIYLSLINKYGFISSHGGNTPSESSNMVWISILKDDDVYSFVSGNNFISFSRHKDFNYIIFYLKIFFIDFEDCIFDENFLSEYNLTEKKLIERIQNYTTEDYTFVSFDHLENIYPIYCYDINDEYKAYPVSEFRVNNKRYEEVRAYEDSEIYENMKIDIRKYFSPTIKW